MNPYLEAGMKRYWVPSSFPSALVGTKITDHWFPVSQGGDIAFLYGVLKVLIENDWLAHDLIENHSSGFDELKEKALSRDWAWLESHSGLPRSRMMASRSPSASARSAHATAHGPRPIRHPPGCAPVPRVGAAPSPAGRSGP